MPGPDRYRSASHVGTNRANWDSSADAYQREHQPQLSVSPMKWGTWGIPESELGVLGEVRDRDVLELGCGAAQWSLELVKRGARCVGIDLSERQLSYARRFREEEEVALPLLEADAERLPFRDASFDLVFCDYGATTFADPLAVVPEVARVLRSRGTFAFCTGSALMYLCIPEGGEHPTSELGGNYFEMHELRYLEDSGEISVEFQLPMGEWIRLFRRHGFTIEDLVETRPEPDAQSTYRTAEEREWARRWPMENIWKVRKT
jgi:SAM-dependent methyltransferase